MIEVTDLHGNVRYINADLIEMVEANPETQIVLGNGHRHYVREDAATIAERVLIYKQQCMKLVRLSLPDNSGEVEA